jgi:hypothetical protein
MTRCAAGTTLNGPGKKTVRSLLIAGCMRVGDPNFEPTAEVHVPSACAHMPNKADWKKGCLFPGALNFDPSAKQSGMCRYHTTGCTTPGALKYNPEATIDDGSCVTYPRLPLATLLPRH